MIWQTAGLPDACADGPGSCARLLLKREGHAVDAADQACLGLQVYGIKKLAPMVVEVYK